MRARTLATLLAVLSVASPALAFTHIVGPGDTLASIAEKYYGKIQYERLLVAANLLDSRGGTPIVRGMRLEVPSLSYRKVEPGETWETISAELLGAPSRAEVLSVVNGSSPWLPPEEGAEIFIPYNLRVIVAENEQLTSIALRHLGDMNKAWVLDRYNGLKGKRPEPGDVLLVPLSDLPLTEAGRKAALAAANDTCAEAGGDARRAQQRVAEELPALVADVRAGRYVEAVARGTRFLATNALSEAQLALVHQKLTEAYVALDAHGLATQSCGEWRKRDAGAELDPSLVSPKVLAACERGGR